MSHTDNDDDEKEADAGGSKESVDEDDELIKALKAAREKKVRNCPPDIKTTEMVTDISFHPDADLVALGSMTGELSVFRWKVGNGDGGGGGDITDDKDRDN